MKEQNKDYAGQYKNPKWQKLRLKILERDDWACQRCYNDESQLQVHHRRYVYGKKIWEYKLNELVTLCDECHKEEKEGMRECIGHFVEILKIHLFSYHVKDLAGSLGGLLKQKVHHPDMSISAIQWIIDNKFDDNIMTPYMEHLVFKGNKRRTL